MLSNNETLIVAPAVHRPLYQCRFCSHWRPKEEFIGGVIVGQCARCLETFSRNLEALTSGELPHACPICERTGEQLAALSPDGQSARMFMHRIEGVLALLCARCSDWYESKRVDVFGKTPHGLSGIVRAGSDRT